MRSFPSLMALACLLPACVVSDIDLSERRCPCVTGWVCVESTQVCVRADALDAAVPDGPAMDAPAVDGPALDAPPIDAPAVDAPLEDAFRADAARTDGGMADAGTDSGVDMAPDTGSCMTEYVTQEWGDTSTSDWPGTLLDTWINVNTERHAADTSLRLYTWPTAQISNAILLQWDLSAIPAGTRIELATVQLYLFQSQGLVYQTTVHRVMSCPPDIAGDQVDGYQCNATTDWTPNSCCFSDIPMAQADIAGPEDSKNIDRLDGYKSWRVTNMVQRWVNDPGTNLGMLVNADSTTSSENHRSFRSTEYGTPDERPKLIIGYARCR